MSNTTISKGVTITPDFYRDLNRPPNLGFFLAITVAACQTLVTPVVWIRLYVHFFVAKKPKWDDLLMFVAWLAFLGYCIGLLIGLNFGFIQGDIYHINPEQTSRWLKLIWIMEMMYQVIIILSKMPVLILYKRIFAPSHGPKTWVHYTIVFFLIFNTLFYLSMLVAIAFNCVPAQKNWDESAPGHCTDIYTIFISSATVNVVSDIVMAVIPVAVIMSLRMSRKRKVEVMFVFAFGVVCIIAAIFRLVYSIIGQSTANHTVALIKIGLWSMAEMSASLTAACIPMIPPFFRHLRDKNRTSAPASSSAPNPQTRSLPLSVRDESHHPSTRRMTWLKTTLLGTQTHASTDSLTDEPHYIVECARVSSEKVRVTDRELVYASGPTSPARTSMGKSDIIVSTTVDISIVSNDQLPSVHESREPNDWKQEI